MSRGKVPEKFRVHVAPHRDNVYLVAETSKGLESRGEVFQGLGDPSERLTIAEELVNRYNAHDRLMKFVERIADLRACRKVFGYDHAPDECVGCYARALVAEFRR